MSLPAIYVTLLHGIMSNLLDYFARFELDLLVFSQQSLCLYEKSQGEQLLFAGCSNAIINDNLHLHDFVSF